MRGYPHHQVDVMARPQDGESIGETFPQLANQLPNLMLTQISERVTWLDPDQRPNVELYLSS